MKAAVPSLNKISSEFVRFFSERPGVAGILIDAWTTSLRFHNKPPHRVLTSIARQANLRLPFPTHLGNGMKIQAYWDDFVSMRIRKNGYYEPETIEVFKKLLAPGMIFIDAGAHIGQYSLVASRLVKTDGAVHAFEPDPQTFGLLVKNARLNNQNKNINVNNLALSDQETTLELFGGGRDNVGANSIAPSIGFSGRSVRVPATRLDAYMSQKRISRINVMKIDVEGSEMALLSGAQDTIRACKPYLLIEFNEYTQSLQGFSCRHLAEMLRGWGFTLYRVGPRNQLGEYACNNVKYYFNVLAVPGGKFPDVLNLSVTEKENLVSQDFGVGCIK